MLRVSVRPCGSGALLGVSLAHAAGDGYSLGLLLRAWSLADAGKPFPVPSFDRSPLRQQLPGVGDPVDDERVRRDTTYGTRPEAANAPPERVRDIVDLGQEEIRSLYDEANARPDGLSTNDVLIAHLLARYHRYAPQEDPEHWIVRCPVGYRHLHPGLGERFFGNALLDAVTRGKLQEMSLGDRARRVRQAIDAVDLCAVRRSLGCFEALRRQRGPDAFRRLNDTGLAVSSFRNLGLEGVRLGGHAPRRVVNLSDSFRTINLIPTATGVSVQFLRATEPLS